MEEKNKITITLTDDDLTDIFKMLGSLAKTSSILQEGDPDVSAMTAGAMTVGAVAIMALHAAK